MSVEKLRTPILDYFRSEENPVHKQQHSARDLTVGLIPSSTEMPSSSSSLLFYFASQVQNGSLVSAEAGPPSSPVDAVPLLYPTNVSHFVRAGICHGDDSERQNCQGHSNQPRGHCR